MGIIEMVIWALAVWFAAHVLQGIGRQRHDEEQAQKGERK